MITVSCHFTAFVGTTWKEKISNNRNNAIDIFTDLVKIKLIEQVSEQRLFEQEPTQRNFFNGHNIGPRNIEYDCVMDKM